MKPFRFNGWTRLILFLTLFIAVVPSPAGAETADKTLSPYFQVIGNDTATEQLPLKSTTAEVNVAGVIADVCVTQTYKNEGQRPIEAIYVFPGSTRAAVYGMTMTIGERTITAKIQEREQARKEYEEAKQQGKSASLLEQQRPNVFQMNVANIMPGDLVRVELRYTELLVPVDGIYEFVYPAVVGPRYSETPEAGAPASEAWVKNPYLHEGEKPPYAFGFSARISAGMPIDQIVCDTHKTTIQYNGTSTASILLEPSETAGGNRDVILKYRLAGGKIQSGLLLYQGEKENFFLLMAQPPKQVKSDQVPAREYIFIVDVSGSMHGFPLDISKTLLKDLIGRLRPVDRFNVLLFAGGSKLMSEKSVPATPENIQMALDVIDRQQGGGGTQILPALERALNLPVEMPGSRTVVIVTDGYVSVEKEAFDLIRNRLGEANVFPFGIGSSVNRYLIEGLARAGMGEPFIITKPAEAPAQAEKFRKYIELPVLTNVRAAFDKLEVYEMEPPASPDVMAERPVILFGKWRGALAGTVRISGLSGNREWSETLDIKGRQPDPASAALRYLWARYRIAVLDDYSRMDSGDSLKQKITRLGLDYNLLTRYTSFVAIDNEVRNTDGQPVTVKQPLPLPEGVSDYAVGGTQAMARNLAVAPTMAAPARKQRADSDADGVPDSPEISKPEPAVSPAPAEPSPSANADKEETKSAEPSPDTDTDSVPDASDIAAHEQKKDLKPADIRVVNMPEKMVIMGGDIPKAALEKLMADHLDDIAACAKSAGFTAEKANALLRIRIGADGRLVSLKISFENEVRQAGELNNCLLKSVAENWNFPAPADGLTVNVEYFIVFQQKS